jgi:hypothetical protein
MELTKNYLINGPNNIIRLTDGKKILYIFGDFHLKSENQNECVINDDYESIDIDKFLFKFMKQEKTRDFDMFIEMFEFLDPSLNTEYKKRYIDNVHKLFNSRIDFKDNKIFTLKKYSNFKFHYFDIRNLLLFNNDLLWNYAYVDVPFPYSYSTLIILLSEQLNLIGMLNELLNYYNKSEDKVIMKIKTKYNHTDIKKKINLIYDDIIIKNIKETIKLNNKIIEKIEKVIKNFDNFEIYSKKHMEEQTTIFIDLNLIKNNIQFIYLTTTDLNFVRRFLDKDYIKNTIIYTGLAHLCDISYILINYFNFKITNIYFNNNNVDITKVNEIENFEYINKFNKYFMNFDKNFNPIQCSNLFNFPVNFE